MYDNFILALQALKKLLPGEAQNEFAVYEARLMENLYQKRLFGTNPTLKIEQNIIIDELNRLAQTYGVTSFNDLCYPEYGGLANRQPQGHMTSASTTNEQPAGKRDKAIRTTTPDVRITLLTDTIPTAYYHYLDSQLFPLVKVQIDNSGPYCDDATLTISTVIEDHSDTATTTLKVRKGETSEKTLMPLLKNQTLKTLHNVQRVTLHITIRQNTPIAAILEERTEHLRLLAPDVALLGARGPDGEITDLTNFLAAWVTPYALPIQNWLHAASERLPEPQRGFTGYGAQTSAEIASTVRMQARAIFQALQANSNIRYRHLPASQGATEDQIVQRIQLPVESLATRLANCIESSVLFASLLEAAAIDPIIVLIPDHAFVGWHTYRGSDQYEFLEMQRPSSDSFENAQQIAQERFRQAQQAEDFERELFDPRGFARIIDIAACRKKGIYSLISEWDREIALPGLSHIDSPSTHRSLSLTSHHQTENSTRRESTASILSTELYTRYCNLLLDSGICDSIGKLRSLFVGELATYRYRLPDGTDAYDRANQLLAYLAGKTKQGRPLLLILLEYLRPLMPDDDSRSELDQLYQAIEHT
jgi:hypothetical protein